ncbi:MAG TPA: glycerophosphodiester phosphodiesterase [Bacillales bacterium]|nr:glycerophosphodiester phosphodiesterase [Bacillales bacterium]
MKRNVFWRKILPLVLVVGLVMGGATAYSGSAAAKENAGHPSLSPHQFLVIGHRGAKGYAPEETLPSFQLARKLKADYIEMDVQMTKDGHLIVMHDNSLKRTTNVEEVFPNRSPWMIKDFTLKEIKKLDAGSWFNKKHPEYAKPSYVGLKVPTLSEVIEKFGRRANYYIETKSPELYPGVEKKLLHVLRQHGLLGPNARAGKVILQSFSENSLQKIHKMDPNIPLVQLLWYTQPAKISEDQINEIKQYAVGVGMNYDKIDKNYVQKLRKHGLLVHPYTVNDKQDMKRLLNWGVTGMFTNYPDRLNEVLRNHS